MVDEEETSISEPIALPGFHHPTPAKYHGPSFPPTATQAVSSERSQQLAIDIAGKDTLQNKALEW